MYKKLVRELSKKVQKITKAEQFVFIFEQSAQLFREIFYKISSTYLKLETAGNSNQDLSHTATFYLVILQKSGYIWDQKIELNL